MPQPCRPSVEACQQLVEATLGLLVEPGARRPVRLLGLLARGSSARRRRRGRARRRARRRSAATRRAGRSPCATAPRGSPARSCATSADLDLLRRPARGDLLRDERLDPLRRRRVGHVERRVAGRAHHLPLEVVQRGARLRAGRRRRRRRRAQRPARQRAAASRRGLRDRALELAGEAGIRDRAAEVRDHAPLPVEDVRLRHLGDPVAARSRCPSRPRASGTSARARARSAARRSRGRGSRRRGRRRRGCGRSSSHARARRPRSCTARTTTPRSSARPACPGTRRATPCRAPRAGAA